jgi:hypothetical protein
LKNGEADVEAWNSPPRVDVADVLRIESGIIGTTFTVVLSFTGNGKVLGRYEATTDEEVDAILDTITETLARAVGWKSRYRLAAIFGKWTAAQIRTVFADLVVFET